MTQFDVRARHLARMVSGIARGLCLSLLLVIVSLPVPSNAQAQAPAFTDAEIDQMLAPIALYPDSLLSQILMASTYPADVKEAAEWSKAHPDTKGDAAVKQVQDRDWEPAVQSLVAFPQVLAMMRDKPGDVQRLGDAFLENPGRVMDRVQVLRKRAQDAGNLKTTTQQTVVVQTEAQKQVIVVQPAQPQVVYVPVYQPTVVYGPWPDQAFPPYYWPPPPYYYPPSSGAFVAGVFWGVAIAGISNSLWGGFSWGRNDVNINVNHYNNINVNRRITNTSNTFVHNPDRRRDVPYRDAKSREQYGRKAVPGAADRDAYRGKDGRDADRAKATETLKSRGADPVAGRERLQGADRAAATEAVRNADRSVSGADRAARPGAATADRRSSELPQRDFDRSSRQPPSGSALTGVRDTGAARASADRGQSSRAAMTQRAGPGGGAAGRAR